MAKIIANQDLKHPCVQSQWMTYRVIYILLLSLMLPLSAQAEQSKDFGKYIIHYSAFTTDNLTAAIAKKYGIKRSKKRALLNLSVLKKQADAPSQPSTALLQVTATNLSQQLRQLEPHKIAEGNSIYYIAETPVSNAETLKYNIAVTPTGEKSTYRFIFKEQFFTE